jgi:hypothetical protein
MRAQESLSARRTVSKEAVVAIPRKNTNRTPTLERRALPWVPRTRTGAPNRNWQTDLWK